MKTKNVRSTYKHRGKNKVAVSDKLINACKQQNEPLKITHNGQEMIIETYNLDRFEFIDKKVYEDRFMGGQYRLMYIEFKPNQEVLF